MPVPAIRATIGNDLVPGTLQPGAFDALGVRGQVFVNVVSDCAWTLVIERVRASRSRRRLRSGRDTQAVVPPR